MILVGAQDKSPFDYIFSFLRNYKNVYWIKNKKNDFFLKNLKTIKNFKDTRPRIVVTGSSLGNCIDKNLLLFSKKKKILSFTFLENFSFIKERFLLNKKKIILPDFFLVADINIKKDLIKKLNFNSNKIYIIGNNYLKELSKKKNSKKKNKKKTVFFISQPQKKYEDKLYKKFGIKKYFGFNEFQVLNDILEIINKKKINFCIKLHPEESEKKYLSLKSKKIKIIKNISNADIVKNSDLVIGMDSMLLLELYSMGANVLSYRPNCKKKFFGDKLNLFTIIKKKKNLDELLNKKNFLKKIIKINSKKKIEFKANTKYCDILLKA